MAPGAVVAGGRSVQRLSPGEIEEYFAARQDKWVTSSPETHKFFYKASSKPL